MWRSFPGKSITEYRLLAIIYGTVTAPYLALQVLDQLVEDEGTEFPLAVPVLRHQICVDDCIFGVEYSPDKRVTS